MDPSALGLGKDLNPDVIGPVQDVSSVESQTSEDKGEAVGPLATASSASGKKLGRFGVVTREANQMGT